MPVARRKKRSSRLLSNRQQEILTVLGVIFVSALLVVFVLILISRVDRLRVDVVVVTGAITLDSNQIVEETNAVLAGSYLYLFPKNNRFMLPERAIESSLYSSYPKIQSVRFDVVGTTYKISLSEREPHSLWCGHTAYIAQRDIVPDCYFSDPSGFIFARAPYLSDTSFYKIYGRPITSEDRTTTDISVSLDSDVVYSERAMEFNMIGTQYIEAQLYQKVMEFIDVLNSEGIGSYAVEIQRNEAKLFLSSGGELLFQLDQDLASLIADIVLAYNTKRENGSDMQQLEYIDVRFKNKILFKFADAEVQSSALE